MPFPENLKERGRDLRAEALAEANYGARIKNLRDALPAKSLAGAGAEIVPSPGNFLTKAADLFESNKTFRGSILVVLLEALVCKCTVG